MSKKILFVAHLISHINNFHIPYIKMFKDNNWEVHVLTNAAGQLLPECDKLYDIDIQRSPFSLKNIQILKKCKEIFNQEKYDIIYCHTPMGGVIGRLASVDLRKKGSKVIYFAHGFHFFKGSPIINWILFYNIEKYLLKYTDTLITLNDEDYDLALNKFGKLCKNIFKINGVGIDTDKYHKISDSEKNILKQKYGYENKFIMIYAAEFINRKNHIFIINAIEEYIKKYNSDIKVLFAGNGILIDKIKETVKEKQLNDYIDFLGFCKNMPEIYNMSDIVISSSKHEGLAVNVMEGLSSGLPGIVSDVRGNGDLIEEGKNGFTFNINDINDFINKVNTLYTNKELYNTTSEYATDSAKKYDIEMGLARIKEIIL